MEVILLERINRLGVVGDVVKVKDGYARNFLLPRSKALRATDSNKKVFEAKRAEIEAKNAAAKDEALQFAKKFENLTVTLVRQSSEEGKLYGSVSVRDVADALKLQGFDIDRDQVLLGAGIKNTGPAEVKLQLHPEVTIIITVNVVRNESEAAA